MRPVLVRLSLVLSSLVQCFRFIILVFTLHGLLLLVCFGFHPSYKEYFITGIVSGVGSLHESLLRLYFVTFVIAHILLLGTKASCRGDSHGRASVYNGHVALA